MKRAIFIATLIMIHIGLFAQRPGGFSQSSGIKGKITGELVDSLTNQTLEYASIAIFKPKAKKAINGTMSETDGKFKVSEMPLGTYEVRITFIGYRPQTISGVELTPKNPDADLGQVMLVPIAVQLDEVEITSERAIIENKVDKIVYNAEQDITTVGGSAEDVLRKVPLLSVDINGNVSLRGNSNIQILMNGKPSGMFANNVADAIKMIPADEIKSVEVITTPGAKYDGEGSGGIINIITKKKNISGIAGNFTGSLGNINNRANLSLNAGKGRFGINGSASMFHLWPQDARNYFLREDEVPNGLRVLEQEGFTESSRTGFFGRFGMFYDLNAYNSFASDVNFRGFNSTNDGIIDAVFTGPDIDQRYAQDQDARSLRSGYDWNASYTRTTKKKGQEFSIATQVLGNLSVTENELLRTSELNPELFLRENSENDGNNLEVTLQTDYVHPFSEKLKMEVGLKSILRDIDSDYTFWVFEEGSEISKLDPNRSNLFDYNQDVYAAYLSFNLNLGENYSLQAGARYELTQISGSFEDGSLDFQNDYENLLPSIILSRKLKNFSNIKISYNQRIQRPSLRFINPFVNNIDQRNISFGNPYLDPEVTHQIELGYNTFIKGASINTAVYYRRTNDIIESVLSVDEEGISTTTFNNVGHNNSFGLNFYGSKTIKKIWTVRGGFDLFTYDGTGTINGQQVSNTGLLYRINLNQNVKLPKGFIAEMFGFFNSPRQTLQGTRASFWIYSFAFKKEIFDQRGSIGLTFVEPFNKYKNFDSDFEGDGFRQITEFQIPFRSFGINFSYRFGKLDFQQQRSRRKRVNNDDTKDDGGSNTQGF